ncbi:MAG: hypothetical protein RIS25_456 [Actinomycetota bacterium]|jgi:predicted  nucleic acid-binding Zn-ribbon protein
MGLHAAPAEQQRLLELVDIDNAILGINRRRRAATVVATQHTSDERYVELIRAAETAADAVDDLNRRIEHLTHDISVAAERITHDRALETADATPKDLQRIEHEIASLEIRVALLSDQKFAAEGELEEATRVLLDAQIERDGYHAEHDALRAEARATLDELDSDEADLRVQRTAILGSIQSDLAALYERQYDRYGYGASLLTRGVTTATGVTLTQAELDVVRRAAPDDVLMCPDSSAILVRTNESGL